MAVERCVCATKARQGVALVVVLAMLVIVAGLTMAFFSLALVDRQMSASSAARSSAEHLSEMAIGFFLYDLREEIVAGSEAVDDSDIEPGGVSMFRPVVTNPEAAGAGDPATAPTPIAASMLPQRVGAGSQGALFKVSRNGAPFFDGGPLRASGVSTSVPGRNGRAVRPERWLYPGLIPGEDGDGTGEANSIATEPPQWIYVDRGGRTPSELSGETLVAAIDSDPENDGHVIGRFAYAVYEVGGLLDINVAGNALPLAENIRRGRLHQVSLSDAVPGMSAAQALEFIDGWRSPASGADGELLFDPARDLKTVPEGDQAFVGRQDLLSYTRRPSALIPPGATHLLTSFSLGLDAPHWEPSPWRPKMAPAAGEPDPDVLNPPLLDVRFPSETELQRGADPAVTVPAGTPVLARRFPLTKLSLLEEADADPDSIRYYFGLERVDGAGPGVWGYVAHDGGRIKRLDEVVEEGREPNFFEILQAVIHTDSLGKSGGNSQSRDHEQDALRNLQIMRIGANIIDQWDADDIPTVIRYPSGNSGEMLELYGTENLPYISQIGIVGFRPPYNRDLFQMWGLFDVWNPHQNATVPPQGIESFRIIPVSGRARADFWYTIMPWHGGVYYMPMYQQAPPNGGRATTDWADIVSLHGAHGRDLTFPVHHTYEEPTTLTGGEAPLSNADFPGLLLVEEDMAAVGRDPLIPARPDRTIGMQRILNGIMDQVRPYEVLPPDTSAGENPQGDRIFQPGTLITNFDTLAWTATPPIPPGGEIAEVTAIYANYGTKTANHATLHPDINRPLGFALQARINGQWRTYQLFEDINTRSSHIINRLDMIMDIRNPPLISTETIRDRLLENTHYAAPNPNLTESFYQWRGQGITDNGGGTVDSWIKFDPRSRRFGASRVLRDALGYSTRSSDLAWDYRERWPDGAGMPEKPNRWVVTRENPRTGVTSGNSTGEFGFQFWFPPGASHTVFSAPGGAATNNPDELSGEHPMRYSDRDGVVRPADGYFGTRPTVRGRMEDRPVILNRPFRSVGELGYVFRDLPWKTLDFASRYSGDLGLLDVFTLEENPAALPVTAGRVNLNTAPEEVLGALLMGSLRLELNETATLSKPEAEAIASAIVSERETNGPYLNVSDLVPRVFHPPGSGGPAGATRKEAQESAMRALAALTSTRAWTFLVDMIVETGRFAPDATSPEQFVVGAQKRTWFHIAVDRITGEVLEIQRETVHE